MSQSRLLMIVAVLAAAGMAVSSVSLYHHYQKSKTSFCDFGQSFNCDVVNRSEYSSIAGIPVAGIGIAGYLALLLLATVYRDRRESAVVLFFGAVTGLAFALYLTYIEGFVLGAWCILCLSSLTIIFVTAILSGLVLRASRRETSA
jgi:uncharacterized membrane protein